MLTPDLQNKINQTGANIGEGFFAQFGEPVKKAMEPDKDPDKKKKVPAQRNGAGKRQKKAAPAPHDNYDLTIDDIYQGKDQPDDLRDFDGVLRQAINPDEINYSVDTRIGYTKNVLKKYFIVNSKYLLETAAGDAAFKPVLEDFLKTFGDGNFDQVSYNQVQKIKGYLDQTLGVPVRGKGGTDGLLNWAQAQADPALKLTKADLIELSKYRDFWSGGYETIQAGLLIEKEGVRSVDDDLSADYPAFKMEFRAPNQAGDKGIFDPYDLITKADGVRLDLIGLRAVENDIINNAAALLSRNINQPKAPDPVSAPKVEDIKSLEREIGQALKELEDTIAAQGIENEATKNQVSRFLSTLGDRYLVVRGPAFSAIKYHSQNSVINKYSDFTASATKLYYFNDAKELGYHDLVQALLKNVPAHEHDNRKREIEISLRQMAVLDAQITNSTDEMEITRLKAEKNNLATSLWGVAWLDILKEFGINANGNNPANAREANVNVGQDSVTWDDVEASLGKLTDEELIDRIIIYYTGDYDYLKNPKTKKFKNKLLRQLEAGEITRENCIAIVKAIIKLRALENGADVINENSDLWEKVIDSKMINLRKQLELAMKYFSNKACGHKRAQLNIDALMAAIYDNEGIMGVVSELKTRLGSKVEAAFRDVIATATGQARDHNQIKAEIIADKDVKINEVKAQAEKRLAKIKYTAAAAAILIGVGLLVNWKLGNKGNDGRLATLPSDNNTDIYSRLKENNSERIVSRMHSAAVAPTLRAGLDGFTIFPGNGIVDQYAKDIIAEVNAVQTEVTILGKQNQDVVAYLNAEKTEALKKFNSPNLSERDKVLLQARIITCDNFIEELKSS